MKDTFKKICAALILAAILASCVVVPVVLSDRCSSEEASHKEAVATTSSAVSTLSAPLEKSDDVCFSCGGTLYCAVIDPTCLAGGFTAVYCPACGSVQKTCATDALGHDYTEEIVEPSCGVRGYTQMTCSRCGCSYVPADSYTAPLSHEYEETVIYPTCSSQGYVLHVCSTCGDAYVDNITDSLGHDFAATTIEPGCESDGYLFLECSRCKARTLLETYPALGHEWEREVVTAEEGEIGYTIYRCSRCFAVEIGDFVSAGECSHDFAVAAILSPTCEDWGYTVYRCSLCGETYLDDFAAPSGHDYALCGIFMDKESFFADISCSRCGAEPENVLVSVFGEDGDKAEFSGCEADLSTFCGACTLTVYVDGEKLFSASLTLDENETKKEEEKVSEISLSWDAETIEVRYIVDGEDLSDSIAVYIVSEEDFFVAFPVSGSVSTDGLALSGSVTVYLVTQDGETVYEQTFDFHVGDERREEDAAKSADDGNVEEGEKKENEKTDEEEEKTTNIYLVLFLCLICAAAAALIIYLVWRRRKNKKKSDDERGEDEFEDWEKDLYDDDEEGE